MNDIQAFKMKKVTKAISEIGVSTKSGAEVFADALYRLAHRVREYDSQLKANQRNLDRLNNR